MEEHWLRFDYYRAQCFLPDYYRSPLGPFPGGAPRRSTTNVSSAQQAPIFASFMLSLLRFLVKCALIALIVAFFSSIGMAWVFAHPEIKTFSQAIR